jgi:hypothetical protein
MATLIDNIFAYELKRTFTDDNTAEIIGATDVGLIERSIKSDGTNRATNALTQVVDTTTYSDRTIFTLKNDRGFDVYLIMISIHGKLIMQYFGEGGGLVHDKLKREDDIRKNGLKTLEIGNRFIVDATQCAKIADYWFKYTRDKKHVYSVTIPGLAYWYRVGEWYTLSMGEAGTNEYISATVECYSVESERSAGGIGTTRMLLRDVEDSWAKTTLYTARVLAGGSPKRRTNRSNIVIVAAADYDGTYDYRCDGTDDDVQIQAAIDFVSTRLGGGTVQLTEGTFTLNAATSITMKSYVDLRGQGRGSTIITCESGANTNVIDFTGAVSSNLSDLKISDIASTAAAIKVIDCDNQTNILERVWILNVDIESSDAALVSLTGIYQCNSAIDCIVESSTAINTHETGSSKAVAFDDCDNITKCIATTIGSGLTDANATGLATAIGFFNSTNLLGCKSYDLSANGSMTLNAEETRGYDSCAKLTNCYGDNTLGIDDVGTGLYNCDSVQQCKSSNWSTSNYGAGANQSYADAVNTDACADSAVGGYNS